jgi:deazaflavin-dependent oxidoreductase (nitroreductase family)
LTLPRFLWKLIRFGPQLAYAIGLGPLFGRVILLLSTKGRRTGKPQTTPLTYEERDGAILIASARGGSADWLQNIQANPSVRVRVGKRSFEALAKPIVDPNQIADYLERQMARNPRLFGRILRMEGLPASPTRAELLRLAAKRPMVELRPK